MTFSAWEWIRLLCYIGAVPAACYLALRSFHRRDGMFALLWCGLALMFSWYLLDLTMASIGLSNRETRSYATPIIVFTTGGIVSLALSELRAQWQASQLENELAQLGKTLNEVQH